MSGNPDPRPTRVRGRLPSVRELGGTCQACGWQPVEGIQRAPYLERAHLLGGSYKEDLVELTAVLCGGYGRCRVHPRSHAGDDRAREEIRAVLREDQILAIIERVGEAGLDNRYPLPGGTA